MPVRNFPPMAETHMGVTKHYASSYRSVSVQSTRRFYGAVAAKPLCSFTRKSSPVASRSELCPEMQTTFLYWSAFLSVFVFSSEYALIPVIIISSCASAPVSQNCTTFSESLIEILIVITSKLVFYVCNRFILFLNDFLKLHNFPLKTNNK